MKYKYEFSEIRYKSGKKSLIVKVENKIKIVGSLLMSDIQGENPSYIYEAMDKVISGESEYEEINGNMCGVEIRKDYTVVYNNLAEDGIGDCCKIETEELRELIHMWFQENTRFRYGRE